MKRCNRCDQTKAIDEFYAHAGGRVDQPCCKCVLAKRKVDYQQRRAEIRACNNRASAKFRETHRETESARGRLWAKQFPAKHSARQSARRAHVKEASSIGDKAAILKFYEEAARLTRETGVVHHVDHIHPLNGRGFCGLHVEWNLQVLPQHDNLTKSNRLVA
jgi:ribosomal protein L3